MVLEGPVPVAEQSTDAFFQGRAGLLPQIPRTAHDTGRG